MVEQFKTINLAIELSGLVLCLLGNVLAVICGTLNKQTKRYFVLAFTFLMADTVCNMAGQFMRGLEGGAYRAALYASNFGEYLFGFLLPYVSTRLLLTIIDKDRKWKKINIALWIYLSASITLLIISQFTGLFYIIDAGNVYHRTSTFFISFLLGELVILLDVAVIIKYRSFLKKRETIAFGIYFIVPLIVGIAQIFIYGIYITLFSEIFSALILFVFILLEQTAQYYQKEQELREMRVAVMMSQIQPHFLYNTLAVIQDFCTYDPPLAAQVTAKFARYLRGNLGALTVNKPIDFSTELNHTKLYLDLEQLRFRDDLKVVYDIEAEDFNIPVLSLQPIAENAVRHGIRESDGGKGTVTVATREYDDRYEITVKDDGAGFNPDEPINDTKRSHIGIVNVRERLEQMVGGKLIITSEKGSGTTAVIIIPKV